MSEDDEKLQTFFESGAEIVGGVTGTAIGLISAGPVGALAGAAAGPVITRVFRRTCSEIYDRLSGHRERVRGGAAAYYALTVIADRIHRGHAIREDGFFNETADRSSADEILEGVIIKSRNEHEEKKTRYYSNIFSTAAFDSRYSPESLNHALNLAQRLTYRQLCLLQLFSRPQPIPLADRDYHSDPSVNSTLGWETAAVLVEILEIVQLSLVHRYEGGEDFNQAILGIEDIYPSRMIRSVIGDRLHFLMQLQSIALSDLSLVAASLKESA